MHNILTVNVCSPDKSLTFNIVMEKIFVFYFAVFGWMERPQISTKILA